MTIFTTNNPPLGSKLRPKVLQHVPVPVIDNPICESWHKQRGINIKIFGELATTELLY